MPSSTLEICDALVAWLNSPTQQSRYSIGFEAVRENYPVRLLEKITGIVVVVFPSARIFESHHRKLFKTQTVIVSVAMPTRRQSEEDQVITLGEEIEDSFLSLSTLIPGVKRNETSVVETQPFVAEQIDATNITSAFIPIQFSYEWT